MDELRLRAVLRGDPQAVNDFVLEFGPLLRGVTRRMLAPPLRTREDDLVQELLLGLFANNGRALQKWDPLGGRSLRNFILHFAELRTLDWLRRQRRQGREWPTEDDALIRQAEAHTERPEEVPEWMAVVYRRFLAECAPEDRRLIELSYVEDRPLPEVARELGLTMPALYKRRQRIRERLQALRVELAAEGEQVHPASAQTRDARSESPPSFRSSKTTGDKKP